MHETEQGVAAQCRECQRFFVVANQPNYCPHCGSTDVASGHGVVVRPH